MSHGHRWLVGVAAVSVAALAVGTAPSAAGQPAVTAAIDAALEQAVAQHDVPGVVAMVVDRRGVLYQKAAGLADTAGGRSMAPDSVFRIASMTKPVTSIAAMQLVEQHRLSLDDAAAKYLPEIAQIPVITSFDAGTGAYTTAPAAQPVTIRHLMTHTSGFGYGFTSPITRDFKPRAGDPLAALKTGIAGGNAPLLFQPGTQWWYGTSTDWLGRVIEQISGQTLDAYFREHVLGPLRMGDTGFVVAEPAQRRVVAVHRREPTGDGFAATPPTFQPPATFSGGGGLSSTAADYGRFIRMVLNQGTLDGVRIVSPDTIRAMSTNQIGNVTVRALKTAQPQLSADFSFVNDARDKWGLGFLISVQPPPGRRHAGSLSWAGINNTWFWIDPAAGIGGVFMSQMLPFADPRALSAYGAFESAVYAAFGRAARP